MRKNKSSQEALLFLSMLGRDFNLSNRNGSATVRPGWPLFIATVRTIIDDDCYLSGCGEQEGL